MKHKSLALVGGAAFAAGAAVATAGVGTIVYGLLRDALRAEPAVDDGLDELLEIPTREPERQVVTTGDGTRLNVVSYGPAAGDADDVIVAVHGWTCNTTYWYPQVNVLSQTHKVVAVDLRGHGRSERGRARPTIALLGQDLDAVLDAVLEPGQRAVLIGHSMGGMTIMSWAAQFPEKVSERVSAVVLASTAAKAVVQNHLLLPVDLPRYTRAFAPAVSKAFTSAPVPLPHTPVGARLSHYVALGPHARAAHVRFVDEMIGSCPPRARAGWGAAMGKLDVTAGLAALNVPTTVIVGDSDRLTPSTHADQIADVLQSNGVLREYIVLDGVGHMSTLEAASRVNEAVAKILESGAAQRELVDQR